MEAETSKQIYTPHLKKVLRSFQASAHSSLHGPNSVMGLWSSGEKTTASSATETTTINVTTSSVVSRKSTPEDQDPFTAPPPFPIQQPPIITPPDQRRCEKSETTLENETITCFTVGGEKRLCFPQVLNLVLTGLSENQIYVVCDYLRIFLSTCNSVQLDDLKSAGILPLSVTSCGLITKSDAERLCAVLLDSNPPKLIHGPDVKLPFVVKVYHECFGKCTGMYAPDLYIDPVAKCIECAECHGLFCPQKFVRHAHNPKENRTCHWGFDSLNWRAYLLLHYEQEDEPQMKELLKEMKSRYDLGHDYAHKYKRKQIVSETTDPSKKVRIENFYPYPYAIDPGLVYWYPNPAWNKVATFGPLPPVLTRDEKSSFFIPPDALPHFLKGRSPYFLHDPSLLQSSGHVLPLVESDRYETHFQANVTYGPAAAGSLKKYELKKDCMLESSAGHQKSRQISETVSKNPVVKKEQKTSSASCYLDSDDTFSDSSTLSGTDDAVAVQAVEDDNSPPPIADDLHQLNTVLNEMGVDASVCTKVMSEVEAVMSRYRKCLKASIQGKKLVQMEFEKVHSKQRQKIHKLKEMNKFLEREVLRLQVETVRAQETNRSAISEHSEKLQQLRLPLSAKLTPSPPVTCSIESEVREVDVPVMSKSHEISEKDSDNDDEIEVSDSIPKSSQPKERVNVKTEPVGI